MLDWINRRLERKSVKKMGGIPLMWLIYKVDQSEPNMEFRLHPSIEHDEYLQRRFSDIADYLRDNYNEWDYLKED